MQESKQITLGSSDSTTVPTDFKYRMQGKVITITYSGAGLIHKELGRILRTIEYWHQGSVTCYRILYNDAEGLGGEVKGDGETAEMMAPPTHPGSPVCCPQARRDPAKRCNERLYLRKRLCSLV